MGQVIAVKPDDVRTFGANAALLLGQVRYWLGRPNCRSTARAGGRIWIAKTREEWGAETGLSPKQLRTALEALKSAGAIIIERHLHHNKTLGFVRLKEGAASAEEGQTRTASEGQTGMAQMGHTTYYKNEIKNDIGAAAPTQTREDQMKSKIHGLSVKELAGGAGPKAAGIDPKEASRPGQLERVLQHAWADAFPDDFLTRLTGKQLGQLGQFAKKCPSGMAGRVLDYCVRNWAEFTATAQNLEGAFKPPMLPTVDFLLRFARSAVQCYRDSAGVTTVEAAKKKPSAKPPVPQPAPKTVPLVDQEDEIASAEEAAKILGID